VLIKEVRVQVHLTWNSTSRIGVPHVEPHNDEEQQQINYPKHRTTTRNIIKKILKRKEIHYFK